MLIDTHAHLQLASFDRDREKTIGRAEKAGVESIVNIGIDVESSMRAINLAKECKGLYATVGIHPHNANQLNQGVLDKLNRLSENPEAVAIGEIGLDYYRNLSPKRAQKRAFEKQLLLAEERQLPAVIHCRDAHTDTLNILSTLRGKIDVIMHCFSGSQEMAQQYIEAGFYVAFAGPVTFPNAHKLHGVAKWINLDRILLETDSPWLAPQNVRGKRNEPAFLPFIAEKIAGIKGIPVDELAQATTENARNVFQGL